MNWLLHGEAGRSDPRSISRETYPCVIEGVHEVQETDRVALPSSCLSLGAIKLTRRQGEVMHLLSLGMSNKEIARTLGIAVSTTKMHIAKLIHMLGARNRTEAAFKAAMMIAEADNAG